MNRAVSVRDFAFENVIMFDVCVEECSVVFLFCNAVFSFELVDKKCHFLIMSSIYASMNIRASKITKKCIRRRCN